MTISFQERGEHLVVRHGRERARERERRGRRPAGVARKGVTNKEPGTTLGKTTDTRRRRRDGRFCIRWRSTREGGREAGREHVWIYGRIEICAHPARASLSPAAAAIKHAVQSLASPEISLSFWLNAPMFSFYRARRKGGG